MKTTITVVLPRRRHQCVFKLKVKFDSFKSEIVGFVYFSSRHDVFSWS